MASQRNIEKPCAAMNATPASAHAHSGTILISAANPVRVSFFTCIDVPAFSSSITAIARRCSLKWVPRASNSTLTTSAGAIKKTHKPALPNPVRNACPFAHPGKEPPQKWDGQSCGKAYAQTSHAHQPHAFPRLPKPAGVEAHPHLCGSHQAGIGGQGQRTQSHEPPASAASA